jgi:molybdate transport system substrate-binding protein
VLASRSGAPTIEELAGLVSDDVRRIALANPDHAPYGAAGREALRAAGVWDDVEPKLVLGENASAATAFVRGGDADAGIIPLSLAIQDGKLEYTLIDESLHNPLRQTAAVIKDSDGAELGRDFIEFVNGEGRETMQKYGFVLPGETVP